MKIENIDKTIATRLHAPTTVADSVLPFFKANEASLTEWLETLPRLNVTECCRKILPAMETMNLTTVSGANRYTMSECIRPCLFDFVKSSEAQFLDANFPLSDRVAEMAHFSINLQQALADSYKLVILSPDFTGSSQPAQTTEGDTQHANKPALQFNEKTQATVIHRTLQSLGMVLLRRAQTYRVYPEHIWEQINALYQLAEQHLLHQIPITDAQSHLEKDSSIEDVFKRLHFFNLAVPNRFRQREIQSISQVLEEAVHHIKLSDTHGAGDQQANFFVALSAEAPALHVSKLVSHDASTRYFHTRPFIEYLMSDSVVSRQKEEILNVDSRTTKLPERTVRRLLQCWHQTTSRQFTRQHEIRPVTIYPGLQNIIKKFLHVPHAEKAKAKMARGDLDNRFSIAHLELIPTSDHHDRDSAFDAHAMRSERSVESMLKASKSNTSADDIWKKASLKKPQGEAQKVAGEISNTSAKGYQLSLQAEKPPLLRVGDVIGILQPEGQMEIAVVRRMQNQDDQPIVIGVELIAPSARVARIINKDESIRSRSALLLPGIPAIKQPISLLSVSRLELPGHKVQLLMERKQADYQLLKLLESNPAFSQYTLQKLDE